MTLHGSLPRATQPPDMQEIKHFGYTPDRVDPLTVNVHPAAQVLEPSGRRTFLDCPTCDVQAACMARVRARQTLARAECEQPLAPLHGAGGRPAEKRERLHQRVLSVLTHHPEVGALEDLRRNVGCGANRLRTALAELERAGRIGHTLGSHGGKYYHITTEEPTC